MPSRLRDQHLAAVIEALLRYAHEGKELRFRSEEEDGQLKIVFMLADNDSYQTTLSELTHNVVAQPQAEQRPTGR